LQNGLKGLTSDTGLVLKLLFLFHMKPIYVDFVLGKVGSINDDKYTVLFDDGFSRKLKEEDLIRVDALKPGFKVL